MLKQIKKGLVLSLGFFSLPVVVWGQENIQGLIFSFNSLISGALYFVVGLALAFFLWGLVKFIAKAGDEKGREDGKKLMVWGIIALLVIFSIWGIVAFLQGELNISNPEVFPDSF